MKIRWEMIIILLVVCLAIYYSSVVKLLPGDDAYITFGISKNFALGNGFVFNSDQPNDEKLCGTTTPGFAIILSVLYKISGVPPHKIAVFIFWTFLLMLAFIVSSLHITLYERIISVLLVISFPFWLPSGYGNEVLMFSVGIVLVLKLLQNKPSFSALISGLLVLVRPEAIILWPSIVLAKKDLLSDWKKHVLWLAGLLLLPLTCYIVSGQLLPNSIIAKINQGGNINHGSIWYCIYRYFVGGYNVFFIPATLVFAVGLLKVRRVPECRAVLLYMTILSVFLYVGNAPLYPWYLTGIMVPYIIIVTYGMTYLIKSKKAFIIALIVILSIGIVTTTATIKGFECIKKRRDIPYTQIANYLKINANCHDWLFAWEGAQIAYSTDKSINWTDPCGLVEKSWTCWEKDMRTKTIRARIDKMHVKYVVLLSNLGSQRKMPFQDCPELDILHLVKKYKTEQRDIGLYKVVYSK